MFSHRHCPSLKLPFKSVFWSFQKVDQLPTIWVGGYLANAPYSFFSGTLPYYKACGHTKKTKAQTSKQIFFSGLDIIKKICNLKSCLHSMILPQLVHIFFSLPLDLHDTSCCDFSKPPLLRNCNCTGHTRSHQF